MDLIEANMDTKQTRDKPQMKIDYIKIRNRLKHNIECMSIEEFIHRVGERYTAYGIALLDGNGGKEENFVKQRLLALDFDEKPSYETFISICNKYNLRYTFAYRTLSWQKTDPRFRAVFVLDEWVTDSRIAKAITIMLLKMFTESSGAEADEMCKDLSRMFLGGKGIIDQFPENRISVMDVVYAFHDYYRAAKKTNYSKRLKTVAKEIGVEIVDGELGIYEKDRMPDKVKNMDMIEDGKIVMILPAKENKEQKQHTDKNHYQKNTSDIDDKKIYEISGVDPQSLQSMCPLLKDYVCEKRDLSHAQKFLLMTSLLHIKGGKKIFFDHLPDSRSKWKRDWKYSEELDYLPQKCSKISCPYTAICHATSLYDNAGSKIRSVSCMESYFELEDCVYELKKTLENTVNKTDNALHLIKAQTAIGKTEIYCDLIQRRKDKKFLIALPTCKLQEEVAERLRLKGVDCYQTKSIYTEVTKLGLKDLEEELQEAYDKGYGPRIIKIIRKYKSENYDNLTEEQRQMLDKLTGRKDNNSIFKERCIVTTHSFFLMMDMASIQDYEVIIDEDILMTLFKGVSSMSLSDLKANSKLKKISVHNKELLNQILQMQDKEMKKVKFNKLNVVQLEEMYNQRETIKGSLPKLLESSYVVMDKQHEEIIFMNKINFPLRKLIILSATINAKLYEDMVQSEREIFFQEIHKARYTGKIIQYAAHTMSRSFIKNIGIKETLQKVEEIVSKDLPIISFKMMDVNDIYFGKTEGFDYYKGKDIIVLGTPHNRPTWYMVVGAALGYKVDGGLGNRRVERNNYSFRIMTFADVNMQNLQLACIEAEIEQAIGRARILRKDCTVYVFSNYPCQQAELKQDAYFRLSEEEEEEIENDLEDNIKMTGVTENSSSDIPES